MVCVCILVLYIYIYLRLLKFMRKRKVQPLQMIAWVSKNHHDQNEDEKSSTVPTNATILSSSSLVLCLIILGIVVNSLDDLGVAGQAVLVIASVRTAVYAPLIICLAVKKHEAKTTKIVAARPPMGLQFHE